MRIVELFAGTASFSRVANYFGHETFTIDNDPIFKTDMVTDILDLSWSDIPDRFQDAEVIWASPPCTSFSQMAVRMHWDYFTPKTEFAKVSIELIRKTIELINESDCKYWFIENPRSILRDFPEMQIKTRKEVCYCKYGEFRMKPTDIWTNLESWEPREMCRPGADDHISAPRGSQTGTQGLDKADSGKVPQLLCLEILDRLYMDIHDRIIDYI